MAEGCRISEEMDDAARRVRAEGEALYKELRPRALDIPEIDPKLDDETCPVARRVREEAWGLMRADKLAKLAP